mmetsp:Transcript_43403/g.112043  ORF Transcript_43403/g.112043 Transcript_43403/m.112043 type:complete len:219 (+) Transcript_43403:589-1245(+)
MLQAGALLLARGEADHVGGRDARLRVDGGALRRIPRAQAELRGEPAGDVDRRNRRRESRLRGRGDQRVRHRLQLALHDGQGRADGLHQHPALLAARGAHAQPAPRGGLLRPDRRRPQAPAGLLQHLALEATDGGHCAQRDHEPRAGSCARHHQLRAGVRALLRGCGRTSNAASHQPADQADHCGSAVERQRAGDAVLTHWGLVRKGQPPQWRGVTRRR